MEPRDCGFGVALSFGELGLRCISLLLHIDLKAFTTSDGISRLTTYIPALQLLNAWSLISSLESHSPKRTWNPKRGSGMTTISYEDAAWAPCFKYN